MPPGQGLTRDLPGDKLGLNNSLNDFMNSSHVSVITVSGSLVCTFRNNLYNVSLPLLSETSSQDDFTSDHRSSLQMSQNQRFFLTVWVQTLTKS